MALDEKNKDQNSPSHKSIELIINTDQIHKFLNNSCPSTCKETMSKLENKLQIFTSRPDISRSASAHRDVESAIMLTLYPISLKYSAKVIPAKIYKLYDRY